MTSFDDIKEKITSLAKAYWERFQETSIYNQVKDRFENLSPLMQKVVLSTLSAIVVLVIFSFPLGFYSTSEDMITQFESKRDLTRELLKTAREATQVPTLPGTPESADLQSRIQSSLQGAQLLPEQIRGVAAISLPATLIPQNAISYGMEISLAKLNLTQVMSVGFQLSQIDIMTTKVKDIEITPHGQDPRYLDVIYRLVAFKVPQYQPIFQPEPPKKNGRGGGGKPARARSQKQDDE